MVNGTVSAAGAQMDIFPSIHTAIPTFLTLVSYRHRNKLPFRYTWHVLAFFSSNIIIATMFLRWHYVIDVVAGLTLAGVSLWGARTVTQYELERRRSLGLTANWPRFYPHQPARDSSPSTRPGELEAA
jgi:membrane-associated phospholipid phosphatase